MIDIYLETERVALRRLTMDDAERLLELDSDPEVMRYLTGGLPHSRSFILSEALPRYLSLYEQSPRFGYWAAIEKRSGEFLGWFHFFPVADRAPGEIELGYRLKRRHWRHGFATEVSRALIAKGFAELGVERVVATTMALNVRSRRVMERVGMRWEKTFSYPGLPFPEWRPEECLEVLYAVTRQRWESRSGLQPRPRAGSDETTRTSRRRQPLTR